MMRFKALAFRSAAPTASALACAALFCITLAWLVPNHYPPWNSFYNESLMAIGLVLLGTAALGPRMTSGLPSVGWVVIATAAIPWLQWSAGQIHFSGDAWVASLYLLGLAAAVHTGFIWTRVDVRAFASWLSGAALAAGLVSSAIAAAQCLGVSSAIWVAEIPFGSRGTANVAQPNNLVTLIGFGVAGLWLLYEQHRVGAWSAGGALLLLLIGATVSQSRTGFLYGPVLLLLCAIMRCRLSWRARPGWLLAVLGLQALLTLGWPPLRFAMGLSASATISQISLRSGRWQVWPVLLDSIGCHPWTGYGWLQNGASQLAVAERHPQVEELFLHAHNVFLDLLTWCGIPLGLLLCALPMFWFLTRLKAVASVEAAIGLMVFAVFGVHAMLELPHHYAYFLIPVGLWVGLIEAERGSRPIGPRWAPPLLVVGTTALAVAVAWDYPAVEEDFRLVRFENLSIGSLRASQPAPDAPFLSSLTAYLRFMRLPITPGMHTADLAGMDAVAKRYPYSTVLYRYAKALALNGRLGESLLLFDKLRHIHGEARYQSLRQALHQERIDGQPALTPLDAALPA